MADNWTMAQLLQAPTEGYEDAIVIPEINANFELKHGLINLVQNKQFFEHDREDPHAHIRYFNKITSTMRFPDIPSTSIKLMLFPFSLEDTTEFLLQWKLFGQVYNLRLVNHRVPKLNLSTLIKADFANYVKANDAEIEISQNQGQGLQNQMTNLTEMLSKFVNSNTASSSNSGSLPSNTVTNLKEDLNGITTKSGTAYQGPTIPTSSPRVVERRADVTKDTNFPTNNGITEDVQPPVVPVENQNPVSEPDVAPVSAPMPNPKPSISYPSRQNDERHRENANEQKEKFYEIFKDMSFEISFMDALTLMPKFASTLKALIRNKEKLSEMARTPLNEHCSAVILNKLPEKLGDPDRFLITCKFPRMDECLALADLGASINLMPFSVWKKLNLPNLTPTCMTLELADRSISRQMGLLLRCSRYKLGVFQFPADFVVVDFEPDPRVPLILVRCFHKTSRALIEVYEDGEIDRRCGYSLVKSISGRFRIFRHDPQEADAFSCFSADPTSRKVDESYYDLEGDIHYSRESTLLNSDHFTTSKQGQLLPEQKRNLKICEAKYCTILHDEPPEGILFHTNSMEEDYEPAVQHQRRVNPKIHDVIKKEVEKLLDAGLIYPISDSPWVSPVHCVPKKGGMTVVTNDENELVPTRLVTGWRVCIDYRKLNEATRKDHFPLPFMDQMLERLAGNEYYCFLDGFSGYFQIPIDPKDQEKTTFTCPYGTFAYRRMPFGLCNAPGTFQRCMMAIFHDMIEKTMEVFMDDFSVFGNSFSMCLSNLEKMLKRCEDTNLALNWEKSHFMVKEGIVLGHKISKKGIEVDKAKIDVIAKLPHPTTVKGIRSFLGHAGFYRRFIKDFSKISRPMTHLLEKNTPFIFSEECIQAFQTLKKKLTEAPILIAPDWDQPFELMYDASDYVIGKKLLIFSKLVMKDPLGSIIVPILPLEKYLMPISIGPQSIKMPMNFMGPFPSSRGNKCILVAVDYLSKWVEAKALPTNDARVVVKFLKSLFARFGIPRAIISDCGTHLCNDKFAKVMSKYGVTHRLATAYYPQTSGQVEVSNRGLKRILERTVRENRASWSDKLDDALWAFRTAFKTPIGYTPYKLVYGKSCASRTFRYTELNELHDQAYEKFFDCITRRRRTFTPKIKNRIFNVGDRVLLFNSRLKIFSGKLKTRWSGPFTITKVFPYGTIELSQPDGPNFKVNGHRVKHYFGGDLPPKVVQDLHTLPKDE
ncbi:reverse transcriptase domain-containing protein [Tanacetum coccineum]